MQNDSETSSVTSLTQDGASVGSIAGLSVDDTGSIIAQYTNGDEAVLGQLALATFSAEGGLVRTGGNMYAASPEEVSPQSVPQGCPDAVPSSATRWSVRMWTLKMSSSR